MDEISLFAANVHRRAISPRPFHSEAALARLVVRHAGSLLDLTILASEYPISTNGGGRIDALGIDRVNAPVVVEFKRAANGTAIAQGLYYLDWLETHRDLFAVLVMEQLGQKTAAKIVWTAPRLVCVAEEIGEREEAVARQIGRTVELVQLRRYAGGILVVQRPQSRE
jgi:hypothetical protein